MIDGIALLDAGRFSLALPHFENALMLRLATPWRSASASAWLVAAAWINRGDCLRQLERASDALDSYEKAIEAMSYVPLAEHPGYHHRLLLAWINHATVCGEAGRSDDALAGFLCAAELCDQHDTVATPPGRQLVTMLHSHRAVVLLECGLTIEAWRSGQRALVLSTGENSEAAIKARAIYCRLLAALLDDPAAEDLKNDWIANATDTVEETLSLARSAGYRADWLADLVRYGARVYRSCQPHFLGEFLIEWCTDDPALRHFLRGEIALAKRDLELRLREHSATPAPIDGHLAILHSLQLAERHISAYSAVPV